MVIYGLVECCSPIARPWHRGVSPTCTLLPCSRHLFYHHFDKTQVVCPPLNCWCPINSGLRMLLIDQVFDPKLLFCSLRQWLFIVFINLIEMYDWCIVSFALDVTRLPILNGSRIFLHGIMVTVTDYVWDFPYNVLVYMCTGDVS